MKRMKSVYFIVLAVLLSPMAANAGVILSPINVYNNTIGVFGGSSTDNMLNQSGLSAGFTSGVTDFGAYIAGNPTHTRGNELANGWVGPGGGPFTGILDFDLGATYQISNFALWNVAAGSSANVARFTLLLSSTADFSGGVTNLGSFTNPELAASNPYPATVFGASGSGQFLRLQIDSHYGNGNVVEIGEVALDASNQVPIPATLALFGLGLAGIGWSRRRHA